MSGTDNYSKAPSCDDKVQAVRFIIQTSTSVAGAIKIEDEEIEHVLNNTQDNDPTTAAVVILRLKAIAAAAQSKRSVTIGKTKIDFGEVADRLRAAADMLEDMGPGCIPGGGAYRLGGIRVGGTTKDEKNRLLRDNSLEPRAFINRQDDHPGTDANRENDWDDCW